MPDFPTRQDLTRVAHDEVLSRSKTLSRAVLSRDGTDANALTAVGPAVADEVTGQLIRVNSALYLKSARRADLDLLVFDRYQLVRHKATPALVPVRFTTGEPTVTSFEIPKSTRVQTPAGVVYETLYSASFPAGSVGPVTVAVRSTQAGLSQHAAPTTINSVVSTVPGAPLTFAVSNALASVGADDEERDDHLRERAQLYYVTAQRGTTVAIERAALGVAGVDRVNVFETLGPTGEPARFVECIIADQYAEQFAVTSSVPSSYAAQADSLALLVASELNEHRAAGITVRVTHAQVTMLGISLSLRLRRGASADTAQQARSAVQNYVNALKPGAPFIYDDALDALRRVPGLEVMGGEITAPTGDISPGPQEVLRTSLSLVVLSECVAA